MDNGGPAFPRGDLYDGMSLRDWFAGSYAANAGRGYKTYAAMAKEAYDMADALLVYRREHPDAVATIIEQLRGTVQELQNQNHVLSEALERVRIEKGDCGNGEA